MARSVLDDAKRLFARGRHAEVIALLESRLPLFRESHQYYYLLGASCLRTGDVGGANTYLRRAEQLDSHDPDTKLCLAALHLRHGETEKALAIYLHILEDRPKDRVALRCLDELRRPDLSDRVAAMSSPREIAAFLPGPRGLPRWVVPAVAGLLLAAVLAISLPALFGLAGRLRDAASPRKDVSAVVLDAGERSNPLTAAGNARYILTEKEALAAFDRAKDLFQHFRDNAARVEINRLLDSNASKALKEKATTLLGFVEAPDWRSLTDIPTYDDVRADSALYRGCAVIWKGRAANIGGKGADRNFDFLVGYDDRKNLEGIVRVHVGDPSLSIPADGAFELLATILPVAAGFSLETVAIHELR